MDKVQLSQYVKEVKGYSTVFHRACSFCLEVGLADCGKMVYNSTGSRKKTG
jgi:hypothetical protein